MSCKSTWRLFRSLLDPSTTRKETQRQLRRAYYAYQGPTSQLANDPCDRYLCLTVAPKSPEYVYCRLPNPVLDAPFTLPDLRVALAKMKRGTAPGRDGIMVTLLAKLPDSA
ncbi:hypothetical protein HPB49_025534 [Dermacentor silvarum]|uniref:Uncharacterized protein n=1 Tax=Dermacentor silvarum TaxID=543639 RepID=A0ACB8CIS7_DERSI|nr:hypothetical protein HPB49_025534 [Dermacentor silvarum]